MEARGTYGLTRLLGVAGGFGERAGRGFGG